MVVELVRRRKLKEEYSVLWVLTAALVLLVLDLVLAAAEGHRRDRRDLAGEHAVLLRPAVLLGAAAALLGADQLAGAAPDGAGAGGRADCGQPRAGPSRSPAAPRPARRARIAVIIPCFNDGALVAEASRRCSEDEPIEIVVVDDGSTDAPTLETLAALERDGARVVRRPNGGLGAARTTGLGALARQLVYPARRRRPPRARRAGRDGRRAGGRTRARPSPGATTSCSAPAQGQYRSPDALAAVDSDLRQPVPGLLDVPARDARVDAGRLAGCGLRGLGPVAAAGRARAAAASA